MIVKLLNGMYYSINRIDLFNNVHSSLSQNFKHVFEIG